MVSFYLPALSAGSQDRDNLVVRYFELGFSYKEIVAFLSALHNIRISLCHLKRIVTEERIKQFSSQEIKTIFNIPSCFLSKYSTLLKYFRQLYEMNGEE